MTSPEFARWKPNAATAVASDGTDPLLLPPPSPTATSRADQEQEPQDIREAFLQGMSRAVATVNIVTTDGAAGQAGVTVSAMSSVSADGSAPTLLVCVHHLNPAADIVLRNGRFAVNLLREDQSFLSDVFAGRLKHELGDDKFSFANWTSMGNGTPRLADPLVAFGCDVISSETVGTHCVIFGAVRDVHLDDGRPLIYTNRNYGYPVHAGHPALAPGAEWELRIGSLPCFGSLFLPTILMRMNNPFSFTRFPRVYLHEGSREQLCDLLLSGAIDFAFLFDGDLDSRIQATPCFEFQPCVVVSPDSVLSDREEFAEFTPELLLRYGMVLHDSPPNREFALSYIGRAGRPHIAVQTSSLRMAQKLVGRAVGYGVFATWTDDGSIDDGKLISRPIRGEVDKPLLCLCELPGQERSPAAEQFVAASERHARREPI